MMMVGIVMIVGVDSASGYDEESGQAQLLTVMRVAMMWTGKGIDSDSGWAMWCWGQG